MNSEGTAQTLFAPVVEYEHFLESPIITFIFALRGGDSEGKRPLSDTR